MDLCSQTPVVVTVVGGIMIKCLWAVVTLILGCVALNVARKVAVRWLEARSCQEKALMEERMRRDKERCDMAWRFIDRCWKVEHPSSAEDATVAGSLTDRRGVCMMKPGHTYDHSGVIMPARKIIPKYHEWSVGI